MKQRKGLVRFTENINGAINLVGVLYQTKIYQLCNNILTLDSGTWRTNHTKNCMNDFLPDGYRVFQKNFEWFVQTPTSVLDFTDNMALTL